MTLATTPDHVVSPYLFYADVESALVWLSEVFGAHERMRLVIPGGGVVQAELRLGGAPILVSGIGPRNRGEQPAVVRGAVYVYVDDVDRHCDAARSKGAGIIEEPSDRPYGDRVYVASDLEGHEWYFAQHQADVTVEELSELLARGR